MKFRNNELYKFLCLSISIVGLAIVGVVMVLNSSQTNNAYACDEYAYVDDLDSNNSIIPLVDKDREEPKYNIDLLAGRVTRRAYIENADYFFMNPSHAKNDTSKNKNGVCTTIAMQLLLGYHNYYSDRRLIPVSWREYKFLEDGYGDLDYNPYYLTTRAPTQGSGCFGTADGLFDRLWELNSTASWLTGQNLLRVTNVANDFIDIHSSDISHNVKLVYEINAMTNSQSIIMRELNANRPVIIGFQPNEETGANSYHVVIAYGHAYMNGELGYITHYGWRADTVHMWVPANWIKFVTTMVVNHSHTLEKDESSNNGEKILYTCKECGYTTLDELAFTYEVKNEEATIKNIKFPLQGMVSIPSIVKYNFATTENKEYPVSYIRNNTFANQQELLGITIPASVKKIGVSAFKNCKKLCDVTFDSDSQLVEIGDFAFNNCLLNNIELPDSVTRIGESAFESCEGLISFIIGNNSLLTDIGESAFRDCKRLTYFKYFPPKYTVIQNYTFYNCNLQYLYLRDIAIIGEWAFAKCNTMREVVLEGSTFVCDRAFSECSMLTNFIILNSIGFMGNESIFKCPEATIYLAKSTTPASLVSLKVPVVNSCTFSDKMLYIQSFTKSDTNPSNLSTDSKLIPYRSGYSFGGWYTNPEFTGESYTDVTAAPNGTLYAKWQQIDACVAEGTLITLADGRQVPVESLTGSEQLLVWNMWTGKFDSAPILFIDKDATATYEVINLTFSDGTAVKVISEHAFWDFDLNRYVFLRSDAAKYIGHTFNKQSVDSDGNLIWAEVRLVDVSVKKEVTSAYSPVTYSHLCYYVNGMLSMPGATEGLINILEVNAETMTYDSDKLAEDIELYGLFEYEEFAEILPVPKEVFDAFNAQYLKIAIGKEYIDFETLENLFERYGELLGQ